MNRFITIHGHFYQPPRENPWLEYVEVQDSAAPYHDWNQRITQECYLPNANARILDQEGFINEMINNYSRISFNFGPTLLSWLKENAPQVYHSILEADRESQRRFGGHGSAMAQAYNHIIMPLADDRDKRTQVRWGITDFVHRFNRPPEGMWLPETAVDIPTLEALAQEGIAFTILSPHQAKAVRLIGSKEWRLVDPNTLDIRLPYRINLPSGRRLTIFFYHQGIARGVAFENLLRDGAAFARTLVAALDSRTTPQIILVATDGESFGHHHPFGDMALAFALTFIERHLDAQLTNLGEFLERFPPEWEVQIAENTSWSCLHGIERWRSDCGCHTGGSSGWHQRWRRPLRNTLDWLKEEIDHTFLTATQPLLTNPWEARDDYLEILLNDTQSARDHFLARHTSRPLSSNEKVRIWKALEMERHRMLMFTSCGWFFSDIAGIETIQDLQYAARAAQLGEELGRSGLLDELESRLEEATGNREDLPNGREVFRQIVKPLIVDLSKVTAHWALSELIDHPPNSREVVELYAYQVSPQLTVHHQAGKFRLQFGTVQVTSLRTEEEGLFSYCVFHYGDHNLLGGIFPSGFFREKEELEAKLSPLLSAFQRAEVWEVVRAFDQVFGTNTYTLRHLFKEGQRQILHQVLGAALSEAERRYRAIYAENAPIMQFLNSLKVPVPEVFLSAAQFVLQADIIRELKGESPDPDWILSLKKTALQWGISFDESAIGYLLTEKANHYAAALLDDPFNPSVLERLYRVIRCSQHFPRHFNPYQVQVALWKVGTLPDFPEKKRLALTGDVEADKWLKAIYNISQVLKVRLP